jgi:hypothetical protein
LTVGFRDNRVSVLGPDKRMTAVVPAVDERGDGLDEVADGAVGAAADGLAGDDPEEVHERRRGATTRHRLGGLFHEYQQVA